MMYRLILGTILLASVGCAPRFSTTHFDRWAKQDLARRAESPAPDASGTGNPAASTGAVLTTPSPATATPPVSPPPAEESGYPDASSSGTTSPDASSEGRVVKPAEEDEVLY